MSQPSRFRPVLPKPPDFSPPAEPPPKRKRANNACGNCRTRKVKCDTNRPSCSACSDASLECKYKPNASRQDLEKKVEDYEKSAQNMQTVFELLRQGNTVDSAAALQRIRSSDDLHNTASSITDALLLIPRVESNERRETVGPRSSGGTTPVRNTGATDRLLRSPTDDAEYLFSSGYSFVRDRSIDKDLFVNVPALFKLDIARWTTVPLSNSLLNHLLALFWTWDNSVERLIYRPMFEDDLVAMHPYEDDHQKRRFCSPFLVNALLALGCLYSVEKETYAVPEDATTRGRQFADAAVVALQKESEKPSIPLYQGLFAMFCYEGNLGGGQKAVSYFLQALEAYKALNNHTILQHNALIDPARMKHERHAISWCLWGYYVTEWRASQPLGFRKLARKPMFDKTWLDPEFPMSQSSCGSHWWFPYPISLQVQPSHKIEARQAEVGLAEIVEEVLDFLIPEEGSQPAVKDPGRAVKLYESILEWKYSLPDSLRIEQTVLPSAILLDVYAELVLTVILRPFGLLSKLEFGKFNPRERCCSHASRLMSSIFTYRAFAILRTEYWLIHPITVAALIVCQDLEFGSAQVDTFIRAGQCLQDMTGTLPLAADCLMTIKAAFKSSGLQVPPYLRRYLEKAQHRKDGLMHHAIAALVPTQKEFKTTKDCDNRNWEPTFQELLDGLEVITLD